MAYGMRPQELAAVGQNVNNQGGGVSDESIHAAMDEELKQERKGAIARNKKRASASRVREAESKAQMRSAIIQQVASSGIAVAGAGASQAGGSGPRSEQVAARAERAGERGNVVRQARLQDRSANLKGKEDIRLAAQKTKLNQKVVKQKSKAAAQKSRAASRAADPNMQKRLEAYKLKRYNKDLKYKPGTVGPETDPDLIAAYKLP